MNEQEMKQRLIQWLDANIIDEEYQDAKMLAATLIKKESSTWLVLNGFSDKEWFSKIKSQEVAVTIHKHLNSPEGKTPI